MINKMLTDEEQLQYCLKCQKRGFDMKVGVVCSLTSTRRTFISSCDDYVEDEIEAHKMLVAEKELKEAIDKVSKRPPWRTILTVLLALIALIKLILSLA
ncbi:hypothetical protein RQM59_00715 [Flavobacteriaceae bacterium S356]|uniref:Uncharacterized protein n=1 Tax=Asprobacillus argus TaxID=3076534 RepID=A0ABU3LBU6_9FLAO|nr:hypothetical protein [Flavobacteriaceae bacterium S356]